MQPNLEFWIDNNLPPQMAIWLREDFNVSAKSFYELHFQTTEDKITVPKILYLNVGNISNQKLKQLIYKSFTEVLRMFLETDEYLLK